MIIIERISDHNLRIKQLSTCAIYCTIQLTLGGIQMDAVNYSTFRKNMKKYMDKVNEDMDTYIITRRDHENVVLMSQEEYNSIMETNYLLADSENAKQLMQSIENIEEGSNLVERDLIEPEEDK